MSKIVRFVLLLTVTQVGALFGQGTLHQSWSQQMEAQNRRIEADRMERQIREIKSRQDEAESQRDADNFNRQMRDTHSKINQRQQEQDDENRVYSEGEPSAYNIPTAVDNLNAKKATDDRQAQVQAAQKEAALKEADRVYLETFNQSQSDAVILYPFISDANSEGFKRALLLDNKLREQKNQLFYDPNKPLIIAKIVADELNKEKNAKEAAAHEKYAAEQKERDDRAISEIKASFETSRNARELEEIKASFSKKK